jgi:hypothetical protein
MTTPTAGTSRPARSPGRCLSRSEEDDSEARNPTAGAAACPGGVTACGRRPRAGAFPQGETIGLSASPTEFRWTRPEPGDIQANGSAQRTAARVVQRNDGDPARGPALQDGMSVSADRPAARPRSGLTAALLGWHPVRTSRFAGRAAKLRDRHARPGLPAPTAVLSRGWASSSGRRSRADAHGGDPMASAYRR